MKLRHMPGELGKGVLDILRLQEAQRKSLLELLVCDAVIVRGVEYHRVKGLVYRPDKLSSEQEKEALKYVRKHFRSASGDRALGTGDLYRSGFPLYFSHAVLDDGSLVAFEPFIPNYPMLGLEPGE